MHFYPDSPAAHRYTEALLLCENIQKRLQSAAAGVRAGETLLHGRGTDGHAQTQSCNVSVQEEFAKVS